MRGEMVGRKYIETIHRFDEFCVETTSFQSPISHRAALFRDVFLCFFPAFAVESIPPEPFAAGFRLHAPTYHISRPAAEGRGRRARRVLASPELPGLINRALIRGLSNQSLPLNEEEPSSSRSGQSLDALCRSLLSTETRSYSCITLLLIRFTHNGKHVWNRTG